MRTIRPSIALGAMLIISSLLLACGSSAAGPILSTVGNAVDGGSGEGISGAPSAAPAAPDEQGGQFTGGDGVGAPVDDARIVRTGTIDLEVGEVGPSLAKARDGIRAMGGYIGASSTQNEGDTPIASVTYRIPSERWEDALDLLRGISGPGTKVVAERTDAVEVTGQVIDLQARIKNLRAAEASLQQIATKAVKISDVLEVQDQLTNVRGQIEQLTAQLTDVEDRASYATLTASYRVPIVAVEVAQKGWDPKVVVDEASASLIDILQALTSAGIWLAIVWLPILLVLGVVVLVVAWVLRRVGVIGPRHRGTGEVVAS